MQFNSIPFVLFFLVFYFLYWSFPKKFREFFLLFGGMFFYGYASFSFLLHFLIVIGINFLFYHWILKTENSKLPISLAVIFNLLNLGFFKYFYFFCNFLYHLSGNEYFLFLKTEIKVPLPLAISFYTFQMIALLVDTFRKKPETQEILSLFRFTIFFLFFPVLIAGPIMRAGDFFPNFEKETPQREDVYRGGYLLISGFIKKVLLADPLASLISGVYLNPFEYHWSSLLLSGFIFMTQLYFDFSGLTDIARGIAFLLGFEIPENFKAPFFSLSLNEFWTRWHITLSTWLRDYLYFSLGGSRVVTWRIYFNLFLTMTLGGFWHGADYTFLAWGAYWGVFLILERLNEQYFHFSLGESLPIKVIRAFLVFVVCSVSVLMFRSNSASDMLELFIGIFRNTDVYMTSLIQANYGTWILEGMNLVGGSESIALSRIKNLETGFYAMFLMIVFHVFQYKPFDLRKFEKYEPYLLVTLGVITVFLMTTLSQEGEVFIYYKF